MFCLLMFAVTPAPAQEQRVATPGVLDRMATMQAARAALTPLVDMMAGRVLFDTPRANMARKALIRALRDIPRRFRAPHEDPLSNARPEIWDHWDEFTLRAKSAKQAARRLRTNSLNRLRQTLPAVIRACLACHTTFRKPP